MDTLLKKLEERNKELHQELLDIEAEITHKELEFILTNEPWHAPAGLNRGIVNEGQLWNEF